MKAAGIRHLEQHSFPASWYCSFLSVIWEQGCAFLHSFSYPWNMGNTMSQLCKIIHQSAGDGKACIDLTSIIWKGGCGEMKQMWDGGNSLEGKWQERSRRNRDSCLLWHFILPANPKPTDTNSILGLSITKRSVICCPDPFRSQTICSYTYSYS